MTTSFTWTQEQFNERFAQAIRAYWMGRSKQARKQKTGGRKDAGTRGEVTGGQHLNAFALLIADVIKAAGVPDEAIFFQRPLVLPGYYRAQKKWDLVVVRGNRLLAAIELKSQSGSFGNNLNNRAEEVLGLAKDFWTAYREKAFGLSPQPWLGYFFLLEDAPKSRAPVGLAPSPFKPFPAFEQTSYLDRYGLLCERLVLERDYTATALVASPRNAKNGAFSEPRPELSAYRFALSLYQHLARAWA
jgi:hypothetical protein